MGFYGSVINNTKSQFSFDKIYPNRAEMDKKVEKDGIFVGRFVLVDYDKNDDTICLVYRNENENNGFLYSDENLEHIILFNEDDTVINEGSLISVNKGDICYIVKNSENVYFQCTGNKENYAIFEGITSKKQAYNLNQQKDEEIYGDIGRGWDSTVWQKAYENGKEKYVMVAELNSVIPTFDLSIDAPTLMPIDPHFDEISSNVYYELHWQPQWGLRVKAANGSLSNSPGVGANYSDETTTWIKEVYNDITGKNELYYYDISGRWNKTSGLQSIPKTGYLPADIYFNKLGFSSDKHFKSSLKDNIKLAPSGYSQTAVFKNDTLTWEDSKYNNHRGEKVKKEDTQELSMILPSLGNAVNEMWDIVYGKGEDQNGNKMTDETLELDKEYSRLKYIKWEDGNENSTEKRLRLIDKEGDFFTYQPEDAETLAGAINSVHDLMGMVIVDRKDADIKNQEWIDNEADPEKIYYFKRVPLENEEANEDNYYVGYYRKALTYDYLPVKYYYEKVENPEKNYEAQSLYIKNGENFDPDLNKEYDSSKEYYWRKIDPSTENYQEFEKVELDQYLPNTYFYKVEKDYLKETSALARGIEYYNIDTNQIITEPIEKTYKKDMYYKISGDNYLLANEEVPSTADLYCEINQEKIIPQLNLVNYETWEVEDLDKLPTYFWIPGCFTTKESVEQADGTFAEKHQFAITYNPDKTYYICDWKWVLVPSTVEGGEPELDFEVFREKVVQFVDFNENLSYYQFNKENQSYFKISKQDIEKEYEVLSFEKRPKPIVENNEIISGQDVVYPKTQAFLLNEISKSYSYNNFYLPSTYYYLNNNNYILDKEEENTKNRIYYTIPNSAISILENEFYIPNKYYYKVDDNPENKQYQLDKNLIKSDTDYYIKHDFYIIDDLEGLYSKGATWNRMANFVPWTIEVAIRKERYEMTLLDNFGRSLNTINGLILKINNILLNGDYYTRDRNTVQGSINVLNDIIDRFDHLVPDQMLTTDTYGRIHSTKPNPDEYFTIDIKSHPDETSFNLYHEYPYQEEDNNSLKIDLNNNVDTLILETTNIDKTGHVKSFDRTTVTLPYSYKTINTDEGQTIANNTQDILNINGDEWIKTIASDDQINFKHLYPNKENNTTSNYNINKNGDIINLETISIDETGHVKKINTETVTLPYGYKTFNADQGSSEADNTQDTISIIGDEWITTLAENDKISLSHIGPVTTQITQVNNETPSFGSSFTIKDLYFDNKGHKANESSHTVTIPRGSLVDADANDADLITQLAFEPTSGKLSTTRKNVGELLLKGYSKQESAAVTQSDTINQGLGKLEGKIDKEVIDRENAIQTEVNDRNTAIVNAINALDVIGENNILPNQTIYTWSEADGKINITTRDISIPSTAINDLSNAYNATGSVAITGQAVAQALNSLNYSVINSGNQIVRNVVQENGKITISLGTLTKADITDLETLGTMATKNANDYVLINNIGDMAAENKTNYLTKNDIIQNYVSIETYNETITKLQKDIEELKNLIDSYHIPEVPEE